jgi:hypothetical protein
VADLNRNPLRLTSILAAMLCAGCLYNSFVESNGFQGQVIDAVRQRPLAAATVRVWAEHNPEIPPQTVVADSDGKFAIQPVEWSTWASIDCIITPCDPVPTVLQFAVSAPGYQSYQTEIGRLTDNWVIVPLTPAK